MAQIQAQQEASLGFLVALAIGLLDSSLYSIP